MGEVRCARGREAGRVTLDGWGGATRAAMRLWRQGGLRGGMCILNKETVWRGRRNGTYIDVPSESVVLESRRGERRVGRLRRSCQSGGGVRERR